jgi:hypothetical protein
MAADAGVTPREIDAGDLRRELGRQGVYLQRQVATAT